MNQQQGQQEPGSGMRLINIKVRDIIIVLSALGLINVAPLGIQLYSDHVNVPQLQDSVKQLAESTSDLATLTADINETVIRHDEKITNLQKNLDEVHRKFEQIQINLSRIGGKE